MAQRIFISVINDLRADQRIHRIASTLQTADYEVHVVGLKRKNEAKLEPRAYQTHRLNMWFRRGKGFYLEYNLRLFFFLLFKRATLLNANDLDTLLANSLVAFLKRIPLVYDSHEYFTELPELVHRPRTRSIWVLLERLLFPRLRHVYTVNDSLARAYEQKYDVPVSVIRNLPVLQTTPSTIFPKSSSPFILLYQGSLNVGRGLELMVQAIQYLPECVLHIIGRGDKMSYLQDLASQQPNPNRIVFKGFVPFEELHPHTCQAHIGLSLEEDLGANYHYSSPNKVYDYIQAHVPVLVSDLPEMRRVVEMHGVGEILPVEKRSPKGLAEVIEGFLSNQERYREYVEKCRAAAGELCWEKEREKLLEIYHRAFR